MHLPGCPLAPHNLHWGWKAQCICPRPVKAPPRPAGAPTPSPRPAAPHPRPVHRPTQPRATQPAPACDLPTILLVGGIGRLEGQYRATARDRGYALIYREHRLTGGTPPSTLVAVVVMATTISHPLREAAARLAAKQRLAIKYIRTPSSSALRAALDELALSPEAHA